MLFGDVVGFTAMAEAADPERVKRVIDDVFALLADDIVSFGGRIDKVLGDGILALFGAPVAHEDDAERAVRAGLRMQLTVADFAEREDIPIRMRIGIDTGEVLVGSITADGDWTAMGDVVNTASRLQALAEPGSVVVGAATEAATRRAIYYDPVGEVDLKGKSELVRAFTAVTVMGLPGQRFGRHELPLVGRDTELDLISSAIDAALDRSRSSLILVAGDAGVGRSRLVEEALEGIVERHNAAIVEAPCVPYGEVDRWFPVAEAIRSIVGLRQGDSELSARATITLAIAVAFDTRDSDPRVARVTTGLLHLLGYETPLRGIEPERAATEAARAVRAGLQARAARQPVVFSVSDLHWADDIVLRLLSGLIGRLARAPFAIVATTTHELFDRWVPPAGRSNMLIISLDPLSSDESTRLVRSVLGDEVDDYVIAEIVDRGGGNPFFLEELADLVGMDATHDLSAVPQSVRGVIGAKLDSIPDLDRELLEHAAVLGRRGPIDGLRRMAEVLDHGGFVESFQGLLNHELLVSDGLQWEFPSNLMHEVAYGRLAKSDRAIRHAGVADYLDEHGGAHQERIAHHYRRAAVLSHELGSVDGVPDDIVDRAIESTRGMVGTRRAAATTRRSVEALSEILEVTPADHPKRRELLVDRARVLVLARDLDGAMEDLEPVLADDVDDSLRASAELVLGELLQLRGDYPGSIEALSDSIDRFGAVGDAAGVGEATRLLGMSHLYEGRPDTAEETLLDALDQMIEAKDLGGEAWVRQNLAWMSFAQGRITDAEDRIDQAMKLFSELGDGVGMTWGQGLLAYVRLYEGDLDDARSIAQQVLAETEEQGEDWGRGMMLALLGSVALWSGDPFEAVQRAEESQALFDELEDRIGSVQAVALLGRALIRAGRVEEGRLLFEHSAPMLAEAPTEGMAEIVPTAAAAAFVTLGEPDEARRQLDRLAVESDDPSHMGSSERLVTSALASLQNGDAETAARVLQGVIDATGELRLDTNANSALALAAVSLGDVSRAKRHASVVLEARNSSYPDLVLAHAALVIAAARTGDADELGERLTQMRRLRRTGEDQMARMQSLMAESVALRCVDHADARLREDDLNGLLRQLGITAPGWRRVFEACCP